MGGHFRVALVAGLFLGVVTGSISFARFDLVERGEAWVYDTWVRKAAPSVPVQDDIVIVQISDQDILQADEHIEVTWPWPRELQGELVRYVAGGGAKAIVIDLLYRDRGAEADLELFADVLRDSPSVVATMLPTWPASFQKNPADNLWVGSLGTRATWLEAVRDALALMSHNQRLFLTDKLELWSGGQKSAEDLGAEWQRLAAIEPLASLFAGKTLTPRRVGELAGDELTAEQIAKHRFGLRPDGLYRVPGFYLLAPHEVIAAAARALGSVTQMPDPDGVLRRYLYVARHQDVVFPSLALAAYVAGHPGSTLAIEPDAIRVGALTIPTNSDSTSYLRFGSRGFARVASYNIFKSIAELAEGKPATVPAAIFKDKYVLIIPTAESLRDSQATPLTSAAAGGDIQAEALANLLTGRFIQRTPRLFDGLSAGALVLLVLVLVMGVARRVGRAWWGAMAAACAGIATIAGYYYLGGRVYGAHGTWMAVCAPAVGGGFSAIMGLVFSAITDRQERRFVQDALGRYTSRELVDELMRHPEKLSLAFGERRNVSVYFSDIAGFTSISEGMEPERLVLLLNEYLTAMTDIVLEHHGVVDKYIGDAVMAFWGAPLDDKDHAYNAVAAALKMRRACERLRGDWRQRFGHDVTARAGVNSGMAVAGNMGSTHKYNYTLMGDMVNLASRLEGANKAYGSEIMISESTQAQVATRFLLRELDSLAVKGKDQAVRVFEVLSFIEEKTAADEQFVAVFHAGLARYRGREFAAAREDFVHALTLRPNDGPSRVFIDRCEILLQNPPAADWDSVWRMKEK